MRDDEPAEDGTTVDDEPPARGPDAGACDRAAGRRTRLDQQTVVDGADAVARRVGAAGMTMRLVAAELGVSAMAAYRYLDGREQLGALLLDRVFAGLDADVSRPLADVLDDAARALAERPGLADELVEDVLVTQPHVRAWTDALEQRLHRPGARAALWLVRGAARDHDARPWLRLMAATLDDAAAPPA
ncbi:TetR family transcriptional regulator [Patulibacter sp. SYSU D01012]|uniref:TetR/AcrR family transcriptional regulator n=1 Tax=Patulibacter sp. SYSU D01012 TaxID=2817381 RepID=UPI001B3057BB|nr:TetR family transcriptional regulator [Patulibacter sp. SYSU D01012]